MIQKGRQLGKPERREMLLKEVMEKAVQYYEDQGFVKPVKLENG